MKIVLSTNADKIAKSLEKGAGNIDTQMRLSLFRAMSILKAEIQQNIRYRSGLRVRTGTLLNSIAFEIVSAGQGEFKGSIGPQNVPYASTHEFGRDVPARFVKPRLKEALRFQVGGQDVFSKGHWIPAHRIPARPYLSPALEAQADNIAETFGIFIMTGLETP